MYQVAFKSFSLEAESGHIRLAQRSMMFLLQGEDSNLYVLIIYLSSWYDEILIGFGPSLSYSSSRRVGMYGMSVF